MSKKTTSQNYPRITSEGDKYSGFLDESKLQSHRLKIPIGDLKKIIVESVEKAEKRSSRNVIGFPENATDREVIQICRKRGGELFNYFIKYCGDPASTAQACLDRHYKEVAKEQFRNRTLQKQRMNSGWRYQFIAKGAAIRSKRFNSVSDINSKEADFNAVISILDTNDKLNIYISVKNRINTMGGADWPKAIFALETAAKNDRNRVGPYICIFGIAMEKGFRLIKNSQQTNQPHSYNTEIWLSDFFWPFFTNYLYEEMIRAVLDVLLAIGKQDEYEIDIPSELIEEFGNCCKEYGLLNETGHFNDAYKLLSLFCGKGEKGKKARNRMVKEKA